MSLITISNGQLSVTVDTHGGAFNSIISGGIEYLWQGDTNYWKSRDYILFPYVGRLTDGVYLYKGEKYPLNTHGFLRGMELEVSEQREDFVSLHLGSSDETRPQFPFEFDFYVDYALSGASVIRTIRVVNTDGKTIHFGLGGHPGFNAPINGEGEFTDWQLEFDTECSPLHVEFDTANYRMSGIETPYALDNGKVFRLRHELFDYDAVVLKNMPRSVTLRSAKSEHAVRVDFPGMGYVGFWHMPKTDAPYVCVEPWVSLPSHSAYIEDIEQQADIVHVPAGETYENVMTVSVI